jgi:hypothetical protein
MGHQESLCMHGGQTNEFCAEDVAVDGKIREGVPDAENFVL